MQQMTEHDRCSFTSRAGSEKVQIWTIFLRWREKLLCILFNARPRFPLSRASLVKLPIKKCSTYKMKRGRQEWKIQQKWGFNKSNKNWHIISIKYLDPCHLMIMQKEKVNFLKIIPEYIHILYLYIKVIFFFIKNIFDYWLKRRKIS